MSSKYSSTDLTRTGLEEFEKTLVDPAQKALYTNLVLPNIMRDPLSHVLNRRVFLENFINEYQRGVNGYYRDGFVFALIAIREYDIISELPTRTINEVLRGTGQLLKRSFRNKDIIGRYSDDSFAIVLTEITSDVALARIKDFVYAFSQKEMSGYYFSVFAGMAYFDCKNFSNPFQIIERAEEKLGKARSRDFVLGPLY
jgi:diguanylate cyclase (GGDEF)-like protein